MSESPQYEAFRAFARAEIRAQRLEFKAELVKEIREELKIIEGPLGPKGDPGERGADSLVAGPKGDPGDRGTPGERGADGIATRAELEELLEKGFADLTVRSLADVFEGVYDQSKLYPRGRIAVWDGQPWLSMTETRAVPGASSDWKLFVKKGRDGRDAKK